MARLFTRTIAILSSGLLAVGLAGCGSGESPADRPETPLSVETTEAAPTTESATSAKPQPTEGAEPSPSADSTSAAAADGETAAVNAAGCDGEVATPNAAGHYKIGDCIGFPNGFVMRLDSIEGPIAGFATEGTEGELGDTVYLVTVTFDNSAGTDHVFRYGPEFKFRDNAGSAFYGSPEYINNPEYLLPVKLLKGEVLTMDLVLDLDGLGDPVVFEFTDFGSADFALVVDLTL